MNRRDIKVRLAQNDESEAVRAMAANSGFAFDEWMDWSQIHPHWLVAEAEGEIIGCLQVCHGRPVGRLEILGVSPDLLTPSRAWVVQMLIRTGMSLLREYGSTAASSMIPFRMGGYKRWLKKRGAITLESGNILLSRLEA